MVTTWQALISNLLTKMTEQKKEETWFTSPERSKIKWLVVWKDDGKPNNLAIIFCTSPVVKIFLTTCNHKAKKSFNPVILLSCVSRTNLMAIMSSPLS